MADETGKADRFVRRPVELLGRRALTGTERRLFDAMDACGAVYYEHTADLSYGFFPPSWAASLGYRPDELPPLPELFDWWASRLHPDDRERVLNAYGDFIEGHAGRYDVEFRMLHRDGDWRHLHATDIAVERDETGRAVFLSGVGFDVTAQRRTEAELEEESRRLREANSELERFTAVVAHDLKAPLRAASVLAGLMREDLDAGLGDGADAKMTSLRAQMERMGRFIDELLAYARAGEFLGGVEPVDVEALLQEVAAALRLDPDFSLAVEGEMPVLMTCRVRLWQVFANLIGNAVRHHDRSDGKVVVTARRLPLAWEFTVSDDGPGIDAALHETVFELLKTGADESKGGTGLGLAIVKKSVQLVGGSISLESAPGDGARFRFTWPANEVARPERTSSPP